MDDLGAKLEAALAILKRLDHAVMGNGRPGLLDRMTTIEIQQRDCPAKAAYTDAARGNKIALGAMLVSLATLAVMIWTQV